MYFYKYKYLYTQGSEVVCTSKKGQYTSCVAVRAHCSCDAGKKELSSDGGDPGSKKCKRGYGSFYGGVVWWSLFGRIESGGQYCVCAFSII
jgi:hypothetical protein